MSISIPSTLLLIEIITAIANIDSRIDAGLEPAPENPNSAIVEEVCTTRAIETSLNCAVEILEILENDSSIEAADRAVRLEKFRKTA